MFDDMIHRLARIEQSGLEKIFRLSVSQEIAKVFST